MEENKRTEERKKTERKQGKISREFWNSFSPSQLFSFTLPLCCYFHSLFSLGPVPLSLESEGTTLSLPLNSATPATTFQPPGVALSSTETSTPSHTLLQQLRRRTAPTQTPPARSFRDSVRRTQATISDETTTRRTTTIYSTQRC